MLDSDGSLRCDRLQFRVHQRIAGNMRRRIENDRHDLQSGFSLQLLFFHGQHRVPHTLCQMKQHALDGSRESVLADGMFQKVPTIPGYVVERRNREWLPDAQRKPAKGGGASERWTRPRLERVRPNELSEFLLLHVDVHVLQNKATSLVSCTFRHHRHRF